MKRRYRELDDVIAGVGNGDAEIDGLADTARAVETTLDVPTPESTRERAFFVEAVAARHRRRGFWGALAPILASTAVVGAFAFAARSALPGEQIYPLRKAIAAVGLADSPNEEITKRLGRVRALVNSAEESLSRTPERAAGLAIDAIGQLWRIERLVTDVGIVRRTDLRAELDSLERRAADVIAAALTEDERSRRSDDDNGRRSDDGDDSSGPGGGDDDDSGPGDDEDNSGPGDDDDNSGPGGGGDDDAGGGDD